MKMQKDEILLLVIVTAYTLAATMVTVFANVYLLDYTSSYVVISIYSMLRYGALAVLAFLSAKLSAHIKMSTIMMSGLILITTAVVFLLQSREAIASNYSIIYIVGLIWGAGEGCFWISMNTLVQLCTKPKTRGPYLALQAGLNSLATIFSPLLSAQILQMFTIELDGYYMMFRLAIIMFVLIIIISLFLNVKKLPLKFSIKKCFYDAKTNFEWRFVLIAQFLYALRDAATLSLTGLLIYEALGDSSTYGELLTVFAVFGTVSNLAMGKFVKKHNRIRFLVVGSVGLFISGISLILFSNLFGVIIHGLFQYVFLAFVMTPFNIIVMNIISDFMASENVIGRTVSREIMIGSARVLGLLTFVTLLSVFPGNLGMSLSLLILYSSCIIFACFTVRYDRIKHPRIKD